MQFRDRAVMSDHASSTSECPETQYSRLRTCGTPAMSRAPRQAFLDAITNDYANGEVDSWDIGFINQWRFE
jgi:hypothetical protein